MEITYKDKKIGIKRGIAGFSLIQKDESASELFESIDAASKAGYDVLELRIPMIMSFLDSGHSVNEIVSALRGSTVTPALMTCLEPIEISQGSERDELISLCKRVFETAQSIGCSHIQAIARDNYLSNDWKSVREQTVKGLQEIADIASDYNCNIAYEPCATFPVGNLEQGLEVMLEADRPNIGIILDTYHFHVGRSKLETISKLDPHKMPTVHLDDAVAPPKEYFTWSDHDRYAFPGEGIIPMKEIMSAVLDIGYSGLISDEVLYYRYTHWDRTELAKTVKAKGDRVLESL